MDRWNDDLIQFARLICEINAGLEDWQGLWETLCDSMDLTADELDELFERANTVWERAKGNI